MTDKSLYTLLILIILAIAIRMAFADDWFNATVLFAALVPLVQDLRKRDEE